MGKGAFVTIQNQSNKTLTISYDGFNCISQKEDGEGSNFDPISGTLAPGHSLPGSGRQYIEAVASGGCFFQTSRFTMTIAGPDGSLSLVFMESGNSWYVDHTQVVTAGLSSDVSIQPADQYDINVTISDAWFSASWMADTASILGNRALKDVVLPGTHDSGTYGITAVSTIAPGQDVPQWVNAVYALGIPGLVVGQVIADWGKTQGASFADQLTGGIRYFDLRVVLSGNDYWICHGMYSVKVDELIGAVTEFVRSNSKEIIILDFNHLYEMSGLAANRPLIDMMVRAFGAKMAPRDALSPTSACNDFWNKGCQVIVLYDDTETVNAYPELWPQGRINSPWPETTDLETLHSKLDGYLSGRSGSQLFVLQGVLTPDGGMIAKGFVPFTSDPSSDASLAKQVTPPVMAWVRSWANRPLNIVIVDWFHIVPYTAQIRQLNIDRKVP